jgi:hypothetical protein
MSAVLVVAALAFAPQLGQGPAAVGRQQQQHSSCIMMAKGFGKVPEAAKTTPPKAVKPKSEGQVRRDKAASDLEKLKATGVPEYTVLVREAPEGGEPSKYASKPSCFQHPHPHAPRPLAPPGPIPAVPSLAHFHRVSISSAAPVQVVPGRRPRRATQQL